MNFDIEQAFLFYNMSRFIWNMEIRKVWKFVDILYYGNNICGKIMWVLFYVMCHVPGREYLFIKTIKMCHVSGMVYPLRKRVYILLSVYFML